jgi:hypothetical protein
LVENRLAIRDDCAGRRFEAVIEFDLRNSEMSFIQPLPEAG